MPLPPMGVGTAAKWSEADMDRLARIKAVDELSADLLWRRSVRPDLADLLDANPMFSGESTPDV